MGGYRCLWWLQVVTWVTGPRDPSNHLFPVIPRGVTWVTGVTGGYGWLWLVMGGYGWLQVVMGG